MPRFYFIALACAVLLGCDSDFPTSPTDVGSDSSVNRSSARLCDVSIIDTHTESRTRVGINGFVPKMNIRFACGSGEAVLVMVHARAWQSGRLVGDLHHYIQLEENSKRWLCNDSSASGDEPPWTGGCGFLRINNTNDNAITLPHGSGPWKWKANWLSCHHTRHPTHAECPWPEAPEP